MTEPTFEPIPDPESTENISAPASSEEEPLFMLSGRKRKSIWPFIVIPLACILLLGGIFAFWYTRPKTIIKQTLGSYAHTWIADNALFTALSSAADSGQIHMELSNKEIYPTPITLDLFSSSKKGSVAQISMKDEEFRFYASPNALMVDGSLLGDTVYGIKPQGIYQQFESSIFYPQAEGKYAIPLFKYELQELQKSINQFERMYWAETSSSSVTFGDKYYEFFIDCLLEEAKIEVTKQDQNQLMEIVLSPEALENAFYSFFSTLTGDEELIAYLNAYDPMDPLTDDFDTWEEEFEWLMDQAEKTAENFSTLKISLTVRMEYTPFTRKLQSLSVAVDSPDEPKLRALLDAHQSGYATLTMKVEGVDALELRLTQSDYEFRFEMAALNNRGTLSNILDLHYLAYGDGSYQLSLKANNGSSTTELILSGTTGEEGGVLRFTLDTLKVKATVAGQGSAEETVKIGLTVELREKAKAPQFPKTYKDLLAITEEEMDGLAEQLDTDPNQFSAKLKELYEILSEGIVITG